MSAQELQRVVVRMLFDPTYVKQIYLDSEEALRGADVTSEEAAWLSRGDERRWRADPLRAARSLQALLEEFPVSALAVNTSVELPSLISFFSSTRFHRAIMDESSLALSFAAWLAHEYPESEPFCRLEGAIASLRRPEFDTPSDGGEPHTYRAAPGVRALTLPSGVLSAYSQAMRELGAHPQGVVQALVSDPPALSGVHERDKESLLLERGAEIGISEISEELALVLIYLSHGRSESETKAALIRFGSEPGEVSDVLTSLLDEGLIIRLG